MPRVLHLLSQRPSLTGSGITIEAVVRGAAVVGWDQHAVVGVPREDASPAVGGLPPGRIHPLFFETEALPFPVPGMSDVMPYRSTVFSKMTAAQLATYRQAQEEHLTRVIEQVAPDVIHSHHLWIMSSLVKEIAPQIPLVIHSHATGIRQMGLCPHLADAVRAGCKTADAFAVLHRQHADDLAAALGVGMERVHVVGAGFRDELFFPPERGEGGPGHLIYIGKYSAAKGLPWLLDAVDRLRRTNPDLRLHVAGSGAGEEAELLRQRMEEMAPGVVLHGQLTQEDLAPLMRECSVCVLPSFYEGLPLVLVEAVASGCRLVATELPGVVEELAPHLQDALEFVPLPRLRDIDRPEEADLPRFVDDLAAAIGRSLDRPRLETARLRETVEPFTWDAVFARVATLWHESTQSGRSTDQGR